MNPPSDAHGFIEKDKFETFDNLLVLRKWCRENLKGDWYTHEITAGGGTEKYFFVFGFDSQKDEMLFRLKQGI